MIGAMTRYRRPKRTIRPPAAKREAAWASARAELGATCEAPTLLDAEAIEAERELYRQMDADMARDNAAMDSLFRSWGFESDPEPIDKSPRSGTFEKNADRGSSSSDKMSADRPTISPRPMSSAERMERTRARRERGLMVSRVEHAMDWGLILSELQIIGEHETEDPQAIAAGLGKLLELLRATGSDASLW